MIVESSTSVYRRALVVPNRIAVAPSRLEPVIVTRVVPSVVPVDTDRLVMVGVLGGAVYRYFELSPVAEVPPIAVTVTSISPVPEGATARTVFELTRVKLVAGVPPKDTAVVVDSSVPMIVTTVPPDDVPDAGESRVTVGRTGVLNSYLELSPVSDVPSPEVTVTSTSPVMCNGTVAKMVVGLKIENDVAADAPNDTAVAVSRLRPVIVTVLPPAVDPNRGSSDVTVGIGGGSV